MVYCVIESYYESDMGISMMNDVELTHYLTDTLINDLHVDESEVIELDLDDLVFALEDELNNSYDESDVSFSGIIIVNEKNKYLIDWYRG